MLKWGNIWVDAKQDRILLIEVKIVYYAHQIHPFIQYCYITILYSKKAVLDHKGCVKAYNNANLL